MKNYCEKEISRLEGVLQASEKKSNMLEKQYKTDPTALNYLRLSISKTMLASVEHEFEIVYKNLLELRRKINDKIKALVNEGSVPQKLSDRKPEQDKDTHIANLQNKVIELKRKNRFRKLTLSDEGLRNIVDKNRKKNGTINYSKLGIELGVKHPTAKSWCKNRGIE